MDSLSLGASLYVPTTHTKLAEIANGEKYPALRSVIFCTEDAVSNQELPEALNNLEQSLAQFTPQAPLLRFIRVRNPVVLVQVLQMPHIDRVQGFVFPKVTAANLDHYFRPLQGTPFQAMVTLETAETFDPLLIRELRDHMIRQQYHKQTLSLRIGGNDLLNLLGMRRPRGKTIYETPVGQVIANLVAVFKPYGFQLSAPVFEYLNDIATLKREIEQDLAHGLVGKTAIHPSQIETIESMYRVCPQEVEMAQYVMSNDAKAVSKMYDSMLEVSTHLAWAKMTLRRADLYGLAVSPGGVRIC